MYIIKREKLLWDREYGINIPFQKNTYIAYKTYNSKLGGIL